MMSVAGGSRSSTSGNTVGGGNSKRCRHTYTYTL